MPFYKGELQNGGEVTIYATNEREALKDLKKIRKKFAKEHMEKLPIRYHKSYSAKVEKL